MLPARRIFGSNPQPVVLKNLTSATYSEVVSDFRQVYSGSMIVDLS